MKRFFLIILAIFTILFSPNALFAKTGILNTKHNLSVSGPGEIKALTETRVCIFCHTPHNASPQTPLWNKEIKPQSYNTYQSSTLTATIPQPTGPTRLCLSCHDGTIGLGWVISEINPIAMTDETIKPTRESFLGTNIKDDHPVSFPYHDSLPNPELRSSLPPDLLTYEGGVIHCSTCHDPHDNTFGMFMAFDNDYSGLCTKCHVINDWTFSTHSTSTSTWNGNFPNPWPLNERQDPANQRHSVAENGCQNCHTPHNAGGPQRLLMYQREEENCYICHNGNVASTNIMAAINKFSRHPVQNTTIGITGNAHDTAESPNFLSGHVECIDCHNPHVTNNNSPASPPYVSGKISNVSGVTRYGNGVENATFEYEICIKCHGNTSTIFANVSRYINDTNARLEFDPINPSYHPVIDIGQNQADMPSLPSVYLPSMNASSMIYCTSCHSDSGGTNGPHGSSFRPILKERYELNEGIIESYAAYALCYRCHDRQSILNDESFQKNIAGGGGHSGHLNGHGAGLANAVGCSVCHDPHGINDDGTSGSHTHLINFDSNVVSPATGNPVPIFVDQGSRTGTCVLICHGVSHDFTNHAYP